MNSVSHCNLASQASPVRAVSLFSQCAGVLCQITFTLLQPWISSHIFCHDTLDLPSYSHAEQQSTTVWSKISLGTDSGLICKTLKATWQGPKRDSEQPASLPRSQSLFTATVMLTSLCATHPLPTFPAFPLRTSCTSCCVQTILIKYMGTYGEF